MKRIGRLLVFICAIAGVLCCQQDQDSAIKIVGGSEVEGELWMGVVNVTKPSFSTDTDFDDAGCTGTLVHPRLVLSAAHCFDDGGELDGRKIYVGQGSNGGRLHGARDIVERIELHPSYDSSTYKNDLAYILLREKIEDIPRFEVAQIGEISTLTAHLEVELVGFGLRADLQDIPGGDFRPYVGKKYIAKTKISSVSEDEILAGGDGIDTCDGDSGGPIFHTFPSQSNPKLIGVTSRGRGLKCGQGGRYISLLNQICWIERAENIVLDPTRTCP